MKTLPPGLQSHLDSGATTLCWCWKLTRRDGAVQGFTDHDVSVVFDSVAYAATTGFTASGTGTILDNNIIMPAGSTITRPFGVKQ